MYAGGEYRLGEEQREDLCKGDAGIAHADERLAAGSAGTVNDDGGGGALLGPDKIALIFGKGQVARLSAVCGRKAPEHQRGVAEDFASQDFGNLSNGIRH